MIMPGTIIKTDTLVQRFLWLVNLTKITTFHSVPLYGSLICKSGLRMHSSLCVDETGCVKAQLYKGNLVSHKYLNLNMTSKKAAQFNSNTAPIFVPGSKYEADSLPLPLYTPPKNSLSLDHVPFSLNI